MASPVPVEGQYFPEAWLGNMQHSPPGYSESCPDQQGQQGMCPNPPKRTRWDTEEIGRTAEDGIYILYVVPDIWISAEPLAEWPWPKYLPFLSPSFLTCERVWGLNRIRPVKHSVPHYKALRAGTSEAIFPSLCSYPGCKDTHGMGEQTPPHMPCSAILIHLGLSHCPGSCEATERLKMLANT